MMLRLILNVFIVVIVLICLTNKGAFAQAYGYQYYSTPNGSYGYSDNQGYGFSFPQQNYYYYNGGDMGNLMNQMNQLFQQFFSQNYNYGQNSNVPYQDFSFTPAVPRLGIPNFHMQKSYSSVEPEISPAPDYKSAPDLYY